MNRMALLQMDTDNLFNLKVPKTSMKKIVNLAIGILLLLTGFMGFINLVSDNAQAPPTYVLGTIYDGSGGPWTIGNSPYIIIGNVTIPQNELLTIDPGVDVKFDGFYNIFIDGSLNATGLPSDRISFTSNKSIPAAGDWDQIRINSTGNADIKYCDVSFGKQNIRHYDIK
jgi:hypothetical protein